MRPIAPAAWTLVLAAATSPLAAQVLYDPAQGSLPAAQGWTTLGSGIPASQALAGGLLRIDTTADGVAAFGHGRSTPVPLDTDAGFTLRLGLQLLAEQHASPNRAGFSLLVQGADQTQALELGFWSDAVWALDHQAGGADGGFLRAETAALDTTTALRDYRLTVHGGRYSLHADGLPLLAGALRDYPVLGLSTSVYGLPNQVFFGDNSSRGAARVELGMLVLQPVPEPAPLALWAAGLALLAWRARACVGARA